MLLHVPDDLRSRFSRYLAEILTPVTINSHPVSFATYWWPLIEGAWDAALAEGLPIISADEWLAWTEARDGGTWSVQATRPLPAVTVPFPPGAVPATGGLEGAIMAGADRVGARLTGAAPGPLAAGAHRRC